MSDLSTTPKSLENDRIKKLREKLSSAQKNLKTFHDTYKDDKKFSSIVEGSRSVNKMARDFLADVTNSSNANQRLVDAEDKNYKSYVFNTALTMGDLETVKGNNNRDTALESVIRKVEAYKANPFDSSSLMSTFTKNIIHNQTLYYNYMEEQNISILRFLIGSLYQELENLFQSDSKKQFDERQSIERQSTKVSGLAKSYSHPPPEKESNKYSFPTEEDDNDRSKPYASLHQSARPNSITELFKRNTAASASESYGKEANKQEIQFQHSKSMAAETDGKDKQIEELMNHVRDLQRENQDIKRQITTRSSIDRSYSNDHSSLMDELKKTIKGKKEAEEECENLRQALKQLEGELTELNESQVQINKESLSQIDTELKRARCQIISLLEQKGLVEKQAFKLKVENEDLLDQIQGYEFKMKDLANHREIMKAHIMTHENTIREKTAEIQKLNFEKSDMEGKYMALKKYEKEYEQNNKQMNNLEANTNILREELTNTRNSLAEAEEIISMLRKEKDTIIAKCETLENFDPRNVDPSILEQIAMIIFTRLTQAKDLSNDLKNKLQKIFGDKFVYLLSSLKKKLKRTEATAKEFRQKYQEKLNNSIDRMHEVENLSALLLQVQETLPRIEPGPKMASMIILRDELERKRNTFIENVKNSAKEREADLQELSKIYEESDEEQDEKFNESAGPDSEGSFPMNLGKLIEENANLKAKLQDQSNEISNLNAQMKFNSSVQETRRKTTSRGGLTTDRLGKSSRENATSRDIEYDEEEETLKAFHKLSKNDDIYLMLRAQASSVELLLSNQL